MLCLTAPVPVQVFIPTVPFSCLWLAITPWTPGALDIGIATFVALVALSQQFHSWAHMKRSELPTAVAALQVCAAQLLPTGRCSCPLLATSATSKQLFICGVAGMCLFCQLPARLHEGEHWRGTSCLCSNICWGGQCLPRAL